MLLEKPIPTPAGVLRPDMVVIHRGSSVATVVDTTVVADNAILSEAHGMKVRKYDKPEVREHVSRLVGCREDVIQFSSVTLNWRGAMASETDKLLGQLGFTRREKEVLSVSCLQSGYHIHAAHRQGTWRQHGIVRTGRAVQSR